MEKFECIQDFDHGVKFCKMSSFVEFCRYFDIFEYMGYLNTDSARKIMQIDMADDAGS